MLEGQRKDQDAITDKLVLPGRYSCSADTEDVLDIGNSRAITEDTSSESSADQDDDGDCSDSMAIAPVARNEGELSTYGRVTVRDSENVHFGNNTIYNGTVTIKQYYSSRNSDQQVSAQDNRDRVFGDFNSSSSHNAHEQSLECARLGSTRSEVLPQHHPRTRSEVVVEVTGKWDILSSSVKRRLVALLAVVGVAVVLVVVTTLLTIIPAHNNITSSTSQSPDPTPNPNLEFSIVPRDHWLAVPQNGTKLPFKSPVPYVIISHSTTEHCTTRIRCISIVRNTQEFHMGGNGWQDIGYNFLVGGDGNVYEGRGWDTVGSHAYGYNSCSIGISFIGRFNDKHPPAEQMAAAKLLIAEGVRLGKIRADYRLIGHRQVSATVSPGEELFKDLTKMPHFSGKVALPCGSVIRDMDSALVKSNSTRDIEVGILVGNSTQ